MIALNEMPSITAIKDEIQTMYFVEQFVEKEPEMV